MITVAGLLSLSAFIGIWYTGNSVFGYSTTSSAVVENAPWAYQMQNQQNTGYSPQTIINSTNVGSLNVVWSTKLAGLVGTPVIVNGTIFVSSTSLNSIFALNESTGNLIWTANKSTIGYNIRTEVGVTVSRGRVFAATTNNKLISLDAKTGALKWAVSIVGGVVGSLVAYQGAEATPLVFDREVIVGETIGDVGARGLVRAFKESDGGLLWTYYTVPPAPMNSTNQVGYTNANGTNSWGTNGTSGCECSGGAVWNVPAVDPNTGIIYFGTGNPYPLANGTIRSPNETDCNLWTDSVVALNSTNGKFIWAYQEVCADDHDLDLGMPVQLFNSTINGVQTEIVGSGGKPGYYYELYANNGSLIFRVEVGIHYQSGHVVYPEGNGGINTFSTYDPDTNMIYTEANNQANHCSDCAKNSTLYAIDASTGDITWSLNMSIIAGGVSSTNDIVFTSGNHTFLALNAETGSVLWNYTELSGSNPYRWSWGPPSVTNGMVFESTWGGETNGCLEAFAP